MGIRQFEQRLERLVEGVFAKTFRSGLEPVEIARRLTREMDLHRAMGVNGLIAPNHFEVAISPADLKNFESYSQALLRELNEAVREHARDEAYGFVGPVHVDLTPDDSLGAGEFLVASQMMEAPGGAAFGSLVLPDGRRVAVGEDPVTAEVRRRGNDFIVVDLGSTNGTRVNGAGVRERRLEDGDEVTFGSTQVRFEAS
jgi:hypothetical protein